MSARRQKLILILITFVMPIVANAGEKFHVNADSVLIQHDIISLKMSVWNCSASSVNVMLGNLPWGEHTIGLVAYAAGQMSGQSFSQLTYMSSPDWFFDLPLNSSGLSVCQVRIA